MAKKDTYKYELHDGHKTVYVGTTKNPERREAEHRADGKDFTNMTIIGRPSSVSTMHQSLPRSLVLVYSFVFLS